MRWKGMIEQLWKSQRGLLTLLGTLLILNLLLFAVLEQWLVPRVADQESRFLQRQAEVRQLLHNQAGAANTPEQLYVLASQDLSRFQQAVPDYQEFTGLIEELLILSSRASLNITQISYSSEELKETALLQFSLSFNVMGNYEQIKKFVHSLEQSVRLITIKQISLQGADADGVNLRLSLETFFRPGSREP
jgi:type IV pilus assembly protein PilO